MEGLPFDPSPLIGSIFGGAVNLYRDYKNRQQVEKWNQIQMEREDTAIQRRMSDYAAAGVNPLLALGGEGASAGHLTAPQAQTDFSGFGDDVYNSILAKGQKQQQKINDEQIKQEQENTIFQKEAHEINLDMMKSQRDLMSNQQDLNQLNLMMSLGIPVNVETWKGSDGKIQWGFYTEPDLSISSGDVPLQKLFQNQLTQSNSMAMMSLNDLLLSNKDIKWDTANRVINTLNSITGAYADIMSPWHFNNSQIYRH